MLIINTKIFSNGLVVKSRKSAIIFENDSGKKAGESRFVYSFSPLEFSLFVDHMLEAANTAWKEVTPKEADSCGSDYNEYYDRRYDDNGYLSIRCTSIVIDAPHWSTDTLFQLNKLKAQSFLYDLKKTNEVHLQ